jgi:hypothetical protein
LEPCAQPNIRRVDVAWLNVAETHYDCCRRFYTCGAGDQHFDMVRSVIGKAAAQRGRKGGCFEG